MALRDQADATAALDESAAAKARLDTERKAHQATRRELSKTQERNDELVKLLDRYTVADPRALVVPKWFTPKKSKRRHHRATALLLLSDLHLDEVVNPAEINGVNCYNREIAEGRLWSVVEGTIKLCGQFVGGVELDGIVVAMLGDIITGDIHDELARTNEAPVPVTIAHWTPYLASALRHLADEFGRVYVPCVDGNHDRTYKRTPAKKRAESSNAWIIYSWLADLCRDDDRITFGLTTSPEQIMSVYDTSFLLTHGDGFRSAGGVGGIYPSLLKFLLRKEAMYATARRRIDYTLMGHWHQLIWGQNFMVNSTPKGHDEYAKSNGFGLERPSQGMFVVTPENGVTFRMPVFGD